MIAVIHPRMTHENGDREAGSPRIEPGGRRVATRPACTDGLVASMPVWAIHRQPCHPMSMQPFRHVHAEKAPLYRAVMASFAAERRRFRVHLRPEDVRRAITGPGSGQPELEEVVAALDQLVAWGNLRSDADTSRVETVEDFYRRRLLYQLTREGEAAEAALAAYDDALGRRGELQAVALDDIRFHLRALQALLEEPELDGQRVHRLLRDLVSVFERLADNAQAFMASLRRTIDLQEGDVDAFVAYKERLISYLERFVGDLTRASHEIAALLLAVPPPDVDRALVLAAERESSDALPGAGADPCDDGDAVLLARAEDWRARWSGLVSWFVGDRRQPSQSSLLRSRARAAIPELLTVVAAIHERRSSRSDRAADFRTLAAWFAEAPDDAGRHRLWRAAFALHSCRHLTVDAETLDARRDAPVASSTSWRDAPPVVVNPRLRATGSHQRAGRPPQVQDRSKQKEYLRQVLAREQRSFDAAREELRTRGSARLSELPALSSDAFDLLLRILGEGLALRGRATDRVRHVSPDGRVAIDIRPPADAARARIETPRGTFDAPDFIVSITGLDETSAHASGGGAHPAALPAGERRDPIEQATS